MVGGVFEVEDAGEAGAGEPRVVPGAVGLLGGEEVLDAGFDGRAGKRRVLRSWCLVLS